MKRKSSHGISAADKRIIIILAIFSICVFGMVGITYLTIDTIAVGRSYGSLKDNWRFLRLDATENLTAYVRTKKIDYYDKSLTDISILRQYSQAVNELTKPTYNYDYIINVLSVHRDNLNDIDDIPTMISVFRRIRRTPMMLNVIGLWEKANENLSDLDTLATGIHNRIQLGKDNPVSISADLENIKILNLHFDDLREVMNITSSQTYEWMKQSIWLISLSIGFMLLLIGGVSTTIVLRSSHEMRLAIEENEQRFRSLFENNPNAVFLKDLDGGIVSSNNAAVKLTGYTLDDLKNMKFKQIIIPEHQPLVEENFAEATEGNSQHVDVDCISSSGKNFSIELTHIPIYLDQKCTGVFAVAEDITARMEQGKKIRDSLREKEVLLSEIHHRVKNNLALISGLIDLQIQYMKTPELSNILKDTQLRIYSMANVHELLYKETFFSHIDMKAYLSNLSNIIANTFSDSRSGIRIEIESDDLRLDINQAIPLGLILNELITNAYKHSFPDGGTGTIFIYLKKNGENFDLSVLTDGSKLSDDFDPGDYESLGMTLIRTLVVQIEAQLEIVHGTHDGFLVRFKPKEI